MQVWEQSFISETSPRLQSGGWGLEGWGQSQREEEGGEETRYKATGFHQGGGSGEEERR